MSPAPRAVRLLATFLVTSTLLACSGAPTGSPGSPGTPGPTGATASGGTAATAVRELTDVTGATVLVPAEPSRVVTLSEPTLDGALALGVTPIGTVTGRGQSGAPGYLADLAGQIPLLGAVAQPNFEAIGAAQPDLILVDGTSINNNPDALAILGRIAPVVYTGYAGGDWRTNFRLVADALGRAEQGEAVIAEYDALVSEVAAGLTAYAQDTFSIVRWQGGSAALILSELPPGQALADLGLRRPPNQDRRGRGHSEPVSLENLADVDADYIFFGTLGGSSVGNPDAGGSADVDGARAALAQAEQAPGFTDLAAYRAGHVILVDGSLWTSTGGPVLMTRIVESVREALGA